MSEPTPALDPMRTSPFAAAERVRLDGPDGPTSFVVLAMLELFDRDYAMMAREDELGGTVDGDLSVYLFELEWREDGAPLLTIIDDDDVYAEVFHMFAALDDEELDDA